MSKKQNLPDIYKRIESCACFRMRAAARRLTRDYDEALRPIGLKVTQFTAMAVIKGYKPKSVTEMAEFLAMERTSLVRTLSLMEDKGWIRLRPEGYRREREITLTEKGEKLLESAIPYWEKAQDNFETRMGEGIWQKIWRNIVRVAGNDGSRQREGLA